MDWNLLGVALLLTLSGLYFLETERARAPLEHLPARMLRPARTALERAWLTEPMQVFMRQLLAARKGRAVHWPWAGF